MSGWKGRLQSRVYPPGFTGEALSRHWLSLRVEIPFSLFPKKLLNIFAPPNSFSTHCVSVLAENSVPILPSVRSLFRFYPVAVQTPQGVQIQHCETWNIATIISRTSFQEYVTASNSGFTSCKFDPLGLGKCSCALKPVSHKVNTLLPSSLNCLERAFQQAASLPIMCLLAVCSAIKWGLTLIPLFQM